MIYKITISEIIETEVAEREYENLHTKDENGKDEYGYVDTGKMKIETNEKDVYVQKLEDLDIAELAVYINRAR